VQTAIVFLLCLALVSQPCAVLGHALGEHSLPRSLSRNAKVPVPFVQQNTLALSPASATHAVGANRCAVAVYTNPSGQAINGANVSFSVTGVNATTGTGTTNSTGQATFCYTGTNAGNDTITASVGSVTATATKTWQSGALIASEAVIVRHGMNLNSGSRIEGAVRQLLGETTSFNSGAVVTSELLVPGTPQLIQNGASNFGGTISGSGSATPTNYQVILNSGITLGKLRTRIDPITVANVPAPPAPTGTRSVTLNAAGQSIGDLATLRNLTLNSNVGQVAVPPGTYGNFIANSGSGFTFGVAGATQPVTYNLTNFTLNSSSQLQIVSPVILVLANGTNLNANAGSSGNPG
jgi:rhamnogalacturonan endolyase